MKIGNLEVYGVIYKITNKVNGKVYIGQTTIGFKARYNGGKWWEETHNHHLKGSVAKYGIDNFEISRVFDVAFSEIELNIKEIVYIKEYNSMNRLYGYNKSEGGLNGKRSQETCEKLRIINLGKVASEDTKKKMSITRKGKGIGKDNPMYGNNPLSYMSKEEYDRLMKIKSENMLGENNPMYGMNGELNKFYGKTHTLETRSIISSKAKERYKDRHNHPNAKEVFLYDKNGVFINKFYCYRDCADFLKKTYNVKYSIKIISDAISRNIDVDRIYRGFKFKSSQV